MEKACRIGVSLFLVGSVVCFGFVALFWDESLDPLPSFGKQEALVCAQEPLSIPFDLGEDSISLPVPNIEGDFSVFLDRPRPDSVDSSPVFSIRLKKSGQMRRISLPSRVDFLYQNGLQFSENNSSFWVYLQDGGSHQIHVQVFVDGPQGACEEVRSFQKVAEEGSLLGSHDFAQGSPFKVLSEASLLGPDFYSSQYGGGKFCQRLKLSSFEKGEVLVLHPGDFLAWKEGKWSPIQSVQEGAGTPIAHVVSLDEKTLVFDAWGLDEYVRFSVCSSQHASFKTKAEDFLTSVRMRSEKQISCMIDKQCFVLRAGDLVLKEENRWKILRKAEEKEAYFQGKIEGDLFVFDRMDIKGGQKTLQGHLFNVDRSQMLPVNVVVHSLKKQSKRKG